MPDILLLLFGRRGCYRLCAPLPYIGGWLALAGRSSRKFYQLLCATIPLSSLVPDRPTERRAFRSRQLDSACLENNVPQPGSARASFLDSLSAAWHIAQGTRLLGVTRKGEQ